MCCVIPPASPAATSACRIASSKLVLPWSTCPITVTTGGRGFKLSLVSSFATSSTISSSKETTLTTPLNASASVVAVGTSKAWYDAREHATVQQRLQKILCAHVQLLGEFANRDAFRDGHIARRTRFRRRDDRGRGGTAGAWALPRWVQLALTFNFAFINDRPLALRRLARVKRFAG